MIGYVKGNLLSYENGTVLLQTNGIGFEITCSASAFSRIVNEKGGGVWTYLAVKEDGISLYGFDSESEKKMFLKLISVSGIGPKMGITVLSGMSLNDLALCIASSDVKSLSTIKGLGKKTAERLILELRESISTTEIVSSKSLSQSVSINGDAENAVLALMSLGYNRGDSMRAVQAAIDSGAVGLENIISNALKGMV